MKKPLLIKIVSICAAIGVVLIFVKLTGIATVHEWYSRDFNYRLQTDALFRGNLAIQNHPYAHGYDWIWGNGMHQNWGLGVPLLRFPFEVLSHLFGIGGFPDRLVFVFCFSLAALAFAWGIRSVFDKTDSSDYNAHIAVWFITIVCFFSPTFIAMVVTRFDVYEEAVAFSYLWTLGLGGLLIRFTNRPKAPLFFLLSFLSGFLPLIRPTGIIYGGITVGLAVFICIRSKMPLRYLLIGVALFGFFPLVQLYTNFLRFGEFFEFGYHRILDMIPVLGYMLKFKNPFAEESFFSAAREMFGSLFLVKNLNGLNFFQEYIHSWQTYSIRFREYYFPGISLIILGATLIGWGIGFAGKRFDLPFLKLSEKTRRTFLIVSLWSMSTFIILFLFYLKKPAFSSRYAVDFMPALAMGASILLFTGVYFLKQRVSAIWPGFVFAVLIVGWMTGNALYARSIDQNRLDGYQFASAITLVEVDLYYPEPTERMPELPAKYGPDITRSNYNIPSNLWGWYCYAEQNLRMDPRYVGLAGPMVTLFFGPFECLEVKIQSWPLELKYDIDAIQVKAGTQLMDRESVLETDGGYALTFCTPEPGSINKQWNLVTIALARPYRLSPKFAAPFRLVSVKALPKK